MSLLRALAKVWRAYRYQLLVRYFYMVYNLDHTKKKTDFLKKSEFFPSLLSNCQIKPRESFHLVLTGLYRHR